MSATGSGTDGSGQMMSCAIRREDRMNRVLIIEDEDAIAELERDYLTMSGYDVVIESEGAVGRRRALAGDFNVVLLDLMLPDEDGFSVVKAIRERSDIPIIVISARKDDVDKIRGLGLGADDYMTKPFSPSELVARVKAHIDRYRRLTKVGEDSLDIIKIRDLKIDKKSHEVYVGDEKKLLTSREYELLMYLVKYSGMTITKEELFENIWSQAGIGEIKTVAVHVNRLRDKIEKNPSNPEYIETIWGSGYRLKV